MRILTLTMAICCGLLSVQLMAKSVILNPYQILNVQSGQLYKAQILVQNGKIIQIGSNLTRMSGYLFRDHLSTCSHFKITNQFSGNVVTNQPMKSFDAIINH